MSTKVYLEEYLEFFLYKDRLFLVFYERRGMKIRFGERKSWEKNNSGQEAADKIPRAGNKYLRMAGKMIESRIKEGRNADMKRKKKKAVLKHFQRMEMKVKDEIQDALSEKRNWLGFIPNDKELISLLRTCAGRDAEVAEILGVTLVSLKKRIRESPEVKDALETIREGLLDKSEKVLMKAAHVKEDLGAVFFHLARKGRHRGYGDKVDVGITNNVRVTVEDRRKIDSLRTLSKDDLLKLEEMNRKIKVVEAKGKVIE